MFINQPRCCAKCSLARCSWLNPNATPTKLPQCWWEALTTSWAISASGIPEYSFLGIPFQKVIFVEIPILRMIKFRSPRKSSEVNSCAGWQHRCGPTPFPPFFALVGMQFLNRICSLRLRWSWLVCLRMIDVDAGQLWLFLFYSAMIPDWIMDVYDDYYTYSIDGWWRLMMVILVNDG